MKFAAIRDTEIDAGLLIDISDLDIPQDKAALQSGLVFTMNSYGIIKASNRKPKEGVPETDKWDTVYAVSNRMLESLPSDKAVEYAIAMYSSKRIVEAACSNGSTISMEEMAHRIADVLDDLDIRTNLCDFIFDYITENVPFALTPDAGLHAQDSQEMTWYPEQAHVLMTIVLLCKIVSPIFGLIATYINSTAAKNYRETLCAQTLDKLLDRKYPEIVDKLKYYIKKISSRIVKEDKSSLMRGHTVDEACFSVFTSLLTRTYVNVNLMERGSNPITMTHVNIKKIVRGWVQESMKSKTMERKPPSVISNDDDRVAQMEIDSMTSRKTADVVPITGFAVRDIIRKTMSLYDISDEDFSKSYEFYLKNPIVPNVINKNMNAVFYGKALGGSRGLLLLKSDEYTKLTCLLQLITFSLHVDYAELAHMMTAKPAVGVSSGSLIATMLKARASNTIAYKNIRTMFEQSPQGKHGSAWDKLISGIADDVASHRVIYNTADYIWNWLDEDNLNDKAIGVSEKTIHAFCGMYEFVLEL